MLSINKYHKFEILVNNVNECNLCPRMCGRTKVLSLKNGNIDSKVLFIGEAPGRLGADKTGIPFYGDQTGNNFERLLQYSGLTRKQIFITNAVLCNPRDFNGNNSSPIKEELSNCTIYLKLLIDIIKPEVIVPLGRCALQALNIIEPHKINLQCSIRRTTKWSNYIVVPMYHPGPRAIIHRNIEEQKNDFYYLKQLLMDKMVDL